VDEDTTPPRVSGEGFSVPGEGRADQEGQGHEQDNEESADRRVGGVRRQLDVRHRR
jgi:hypothetical protein